MACFARPRLCDLRGVISATRSAPRGPRTVPDAMAVVLCRRSAPPAAPLDFKRERDELVFVARAPSPKGGLGLAPAPGSKGGFPHTRMRMHVSESAGVGNFGVRPGSQQNHLQCAPGRVPTRRVSSTPRSHRGEEWERGVVGRPPPGVLCKLLGALHVRPPQRANIGRRMAQLGPNQTKGGQNWPRSGPTRHACPNSGQLRAKVVVAPHSDFRVTLLFRKVV